MPDMDASERSRRWWLSHEWQVLLALAIIAAIGLGWLGWQASIVRYRRSMREQIEAGGGVIQQLTDGWRAAPRIRSFDPDYRISWIRQLLGDEEVYIIEFDRQLTASDRIAVEAFPEASVDGIP